MQQTSQFCFNLLTLNIKIQFYQFIHNFTFSNKILPVLLYCSNIIVGASVTHKTQMENIQSRALRIINNNTNLVSLPTVNHTRNKRCALEVFKCLNGLAPRMFQDYFTKISHFKETRGNNTNLVLPKVRTETGRETFAFQGSLIYNMRLR